ncbi:hypothetical protein R1sor_001161 [Riccia sorocarpa]|uniref:CCHC-type domain-containing protein n=1 Tax=Riccia sorocarpa TaxID=122646 RepID=A0ABD3GZ52_9MARC
MRNSKGEVASRWKCARDKHWPVCKALFSSVEEVEHDIPPDLPPEDFPPLQRSDKSSASPDTVAGNTSADTLKARIPRTNAWINRSFLATNRVRHVDSPYLDNVDPLWGKDIPDSDLHAVLEELVKLNPPGDLNGAKFVKWNNEDTVTTKIRLDQLRKASVIVSTPESTPTRDEIERWLEFSVVSTLKVSISQLRVLRRQLFLLVLANQEQRDKILNIPDLSLDGFPVITVPWTVDFNSKKESVTRTATWVEFPGIDPVLEHLGNHMLAELGQPTYRTITKGVNKYSNMQGCVMMHEGSDCPTKLVFDLLWGGQAVQVIKYQDVPNLCFKCRRPGHQARNCTYQGNQGQTQPGAGTSNPINTPHRHRHLQLRDLNRFRLEKTGLYLLNPGEGKEKMGSSPDPGHTSASLNLYDALDVLAEDTMLQSKRILTQGLLSVLVLASKRRAQLQ